MITECEPIDSESDCSACELCDSSDNESESSRRRVPADAPHAESSRRVVEAVPPVSLDAESQQKWQFTVDACSKSAPGRVDIDNIDKDVSAAIDWMASNSPQDIIKFREDAISDIEFRQHELWESGEATEWLMSADPHARVIAQDVNGPLIEELAAASGFWDPECIDMFRFGAPVVGKLPLSGSGPPCAVTEPVPVEDLREKCGERNRALLSTLREDPHADFLMSQIKKDAALGRITEPVSITQVDLDKVVLARRFSVEQGTKADGSPKLRAVDDESANGTNSCCAQTEKPACDSMDAFVRSIVRFSRKTGVAPAFWKADIDAAYRRIPVMPEHRWLLWIVILIGGDLFAAMHTALCFGCIGSVLGWNRIGALIAHVARVVLKLPVNRYVDDLFGVDWPQCTVHAMQCFARLVRAMLGFTAIAAAKLNAGAPLDVLGLMISASPSSVFVQLTREKAV